MSKPSDQDPAKRRPKSRAKPKKSAAALFDDAPRKRAAGGEDAENESRNLKVRVKTAKGRKLSSTRWLQRQLNDPYVQRARDEGYRSRAAFKLAELDDMFALLKPGGRVLDLGCAPGGWCQVAVKKVGAPKKGAVVGVDIQEVEPIPGATLIVGDFLEAETVEIVREAIGGRADVVLSDMAASASGHKGTDHMRIVALCEAALEFAEEVLEPGGAFVAKVLQGGAEAELLARLKRGFKSVRHAKPKASRADSAEIYVVAKGFRKGA